MRTIGSPAASVECIPCRLSNARLVWISSGPKKDLVDRKGTPIPAEIEWASLAAVATNDARDVVDGAILSLTTEEFLELRTRESRYRCCEVWGALKTVDPNATKFSAADVRAFAIESVPERPAGNLYLRRQILREMNAARRGLRLSRLSWWNRPRARYGITADDQFVEGLRSKKAEQRLRDVRKTISDKLFASAADRNVLSEFRRSYGLRPIVLTAARYDEIMTIAKSTVDVLSESIRLFSRDRSLAELAGYGESDLALLEVCIERGELQPMVCRVDLALSGGRVQVLELNADSPGGMAQFDVLAKEGTCLQESLRGGDGNVCDEVVDGVVAALKKRGTNGGRAIVLDESPEEWATYPEMQQFARLLGGKLSSAEVADVAGWKASVDDTALRDSRGVVHLIYKRILWKDLRAKGLVDPRGVLEQAYIQDLALIVNSLGSRMAGNKILLALAGSDQFETKLAEAGGSVPEEALNVFRAALPEADVWGGLERVRGWKPKPRHLLDEDRRTDRVLKSFHGFGGDEVVVAARAERPIHQFTSRWNDAAKPGENDTRWIAQDYVPHGRVRMPVLDEGEIHWQHHRFILGVYVICGQAVGIEAKTSPTLPINMKRGACRTAVLHV